VTTEDNKEIVRRFLDALVDEDTATMRPLVRDDVTWWAPQSAVGTRLPERRLHGWSDIPWLGGPGWKGFRPGTSTVTIHHLVAEDDLVSAHYNRKAMRTTGTTYDNEYNILFRLEDGVIVEVWEVVDTAYAYAVV
jgi:ketosteroid isomerase-like protein